MTESADEKVRAAKPPAAVTEPTTDLEVRTPSVAQTEALPESPRRQPILSLAWERFKRLRSGSDNWLDKHQGFSVGVAALAAVAAAVVSSLQWGAMDRTLTLMSDANSIAERSWRDSRRALVLFLKPNAFQTVEQPFGWPIPIINRGVIPSPNYVIEQECVVKVSSTVEPEQIDCPDYPHAYRQLDVGVREDTIPKVYIPGLPVTEEGEFCPGGGRGVPLPIFLWAQEVERGWANTYVYLRISYDDGLGGTWRRQGCWKFTRLTPFGDLPPPELRYHRLEPCENIPSTEVRIR